MKVLTLKQPWATLVVIGAKKIETRGFNTKYTGDILIHSSAKIDSDGKALSKQEPFADALKNIDELPHGYIIGKVRIHGTAPTDFIVQCSKSSIPLVEGKKFSASEWQRELAFGDYRKGRFGWLLKDPVAFKHLISFQGGVGFTKEFYDRVCLQCGCTDNDCRDCIKRTGMPCHWVKENLCSACYQQ